MANRLPITPKQRKYIKHRAMLSEQQRCIRIVRHIGHATGATRQTIEALVTWIISGKDPTSG